MSMQTIRLASKWLLLVGLVGLSAGCSSGEDSAGDYGARFCNLYKPCCAKAGMNGDQSTCRALYGSVQPTNKALADQCLKEFQALAQQPDFCDFKFTTPDSCSKAFPDQGSGGTKPPGAECAHSSDCAGDATCETDFNTNKGTCAAFVVVAAGQACVGEKEGGSKSWSGSAQQNQITLCDFDAGQVCESNVCKPRAAIGGDCTSSHSCVDGAYCQSSKCAAQLATGSACTNTSSSECNEAAYCVDTTKTCEPRRADGESCTQDKECTSDYCSNSVCTYNPGLAGLVLAFVCN